MQANCIATSKYSAKSVLALLALLETGHRQGNLPYTPFLIPPDLTTTSAEREREMLPTSSQKGLSRVGHERPLNTNSCADQPTNKRRVHESCIEGIKHR